MLGQAEAIDGDTTGLVRDSKDNPQIVFNFLFLPQMVRFEDSPKQLQISPRWARYGNLYEVTGAVPQNLQTRGRKPESKTNTSKRTRKSVGPVAYDPIHEKMKLCLFKQLHALHPNRVDRERDYHDLEVACEGHRWIIEIKSCPSARQTIREALGQLLQYGWNTDASCFASNCTLVIVGPTACTNEDNQFLTAIRNLGLPICYQQYLPHGFQLPRLPMV